MSNSINNIDILLPCYNPIHGWESVIVERFETLQESFPSFNFQLIIVNDGSSVNLHTGINYLKSAIPNLTFLDVSINQGKGAALRTGLAKSNAPICIFTDIDFPFTHKSLVDIVTTLVKGDTDVATGFRDTTYYQHVPKYRKAVSKSLRLLVKTVMRLPVTDTQCGLKGFNSKGKSVFAQTTINRYLFDIEFLKMCGKYRLKVKPVLVELRPGVELSKLNVRLLLNEFTDFIKILFI